MVRFKILILFTLLFLNSCDFSSRLYKQILTAQDFILKQRFKDGVKIYENILKQDCPLDIKIKIYFQLGEIYSTHFFNNKKAIYYFKQIKKISNDPLWDYKSEEKIADINFSYLNDYKNSAKNYLNLSRFIPKRKDHDLYEYRLGVSYLNSSMITKAIDVFKMIIEDKNHKYHILSFNNLGMSYYRKKKWERAIDYWNKYISLEKRNDRIIKTKFLIANSYETMEKLKEAYDIYYSILGEYPNTQVIKNRLNSIYERKVARRR